MEGETVCQLPVSSAPELPKKLIAYNKIYAAAGAADVGNNDNNDTNNDDNNNEI